MYAIKSLIFESTDKLILEYIHTHHRPTKNVFLYRYKYNIDLQNYKKKTNCYTPLTQMLHADDGQG